MTPTVFMQQPAILDLISGMAEQLQSIIRERQLINPVMIGIHTGGVWVADHLHKKLGLADELGTLNISFYRDDFSRIGLNPRVKPSNIPFDIEDRPVILVDDVLQTGRTIRAAMNEIFDFGRPSAIILAVLVNKTGRELPVQADVTGMTPTLKPNDYLFLRGPEPLEMQLGQKTASSGNND